MIRLILLLALSYSATQYYQYNNFDEPNPTLPVVLDSLNINNAWQIAEPNKTVFTSAYSAPNVILTDSVASYAVNDTSSFVIEIDEYYFWSGLPFIIVSWQQWLDTEQDVDGAVVEYSFITPDDWINVFTDTLTQPWAMTNNNHGELFNGQIGMSGTESSWQYTSFCWSDAFIPAEVDKMYLRFTFYSDSTDTQQDGWMIDHIEAFPTLIDYTNESRETQPIQLKAWPNPTSDFIHVSWSEEILQNEQTPSKVVLLNQSGKVLKETSIDSRQRELQWRIADLPNGIYTIFLQDNESLLGTYRFIKQ